MYSYFFISMYYLGFYKMDFKYLFQSLTTVISECRLNKFIFITKEDIKITITINFYNGPTKLEQLFH